jgi:hypothetical protein
MQLGKMAHIGGKWVRISLTDEESREAFEELTKLNLRELTRVIKIIKMTSITTDINQMEAIRMLFEKQGVSAYTYLINKVDEKIERQKNPSIPEKPKLEPDLEADNPFDAGETEGEYTELATEIPKKKKGIFG